jgi:hypothetical protein
MRNLKISKIRCLIESLTNIFFPLAISTNMTTVTTTDAALLTTIVSTNTGQYIAIVAHYVCSMAFRIRES